MLNKKIHLKNRNAKSRAKPWWQQWGSPLRPWEAILSLPLGVMPYFFLTRTVDAIGVRLRESAHRHEYSQIDVDYVTALGRTSKAAGGTSNCMSDAEYDQSNES